MGSGLVDQDIEHARATLGIAADEQVDAALVERRWREARDRAGAVAGAPTPRQADDARDTLLEWIGLGRPDLGGEERVAGIARMAALGEIEKERKRSRGLGFWAGRIALGVLGLLVLLAVIGALVPAGPACEVVHVGSDERVYTINEQLDAGFRVEAVVENRGGEGDVLVEVTLDSSQGAWTRSWQGRMAAGERRSVVGDFHEPTLGAVNLRPMARCTDL